MTSTPPRLACPECGAALGAGRTCQDHFHELLGLETQVVGPSWAEPHFLAVATYNLQHPDQFTPATLMRLREAVAAVLAERATFADVRRRVRRATDGPARVRRRSETPLSEAERTALAAWPRRWSTTVRDVSAVAPEDYVERVREWAREVTKALDAALAGTDPRVPLDAAGMGPESQR